MPRQAKKKSTEKLAQEELAGLPSLEPEITYRAVPHDPTTEDIQDLPVWRVQLELASNPTQQLGLDVNGEVILGRNIDLPNLIDLSEFGAGTEGVSRKHLMLRPTATSLYVLDLGSTNGTLRNGRSIGVNTPYPVSNMDTITLGALRLVIHIIKRPSLHTAPVRKKLDLADALSQIAKAITSQLDLNEVLNQVVEAARLLTSAGETAIWLVDEKSGELFLEAERGIEDEEIRQMRLPIHDDTLVGKVMKTHKPLRANRKPGEEQIKVKTGYLVEALAYVPVSLGGITFGVLAAGHRERAKNFSRRDERLLEAIADFAAIAIQNARLFQATDQALARRVKELSALNEVSRAVSASLNLNEVYAVLVEEVNKHWPVEAVRLLLFNEKNEALYPLKNVTANHKDATAPLITQGIMWEVATTGQVIVTNDVPNYPQYDADVDGFDEQAPRSLVSVPLRIQDRIVGVLTLINKADGPFQDDDVNRLQAFANPIATAIENARLFAEAERQRAAIEATARTLSQPLIILDERGQVLISNQAANQILETKMAQLFEGIRQGLGRTTEITIGNQTYLTTTQHLKNVGTFVVMQDITYVKRLERDRAEFMRALSHDLKSPLTSIRGFAQLLRRVLTLNERGEQYIHKIVASADRMLGMINQLLQVARSDTIEVERQPCRVEDMVAKAMSDVEGAALHKSIEIDFKQTGQSYPILADAIRLYHMALNLIDNAVKYSPSNTCVTVCLHYTEETVTFQVQDEGPGIPEEDLPRVFDKYYRGAKASTQPGAGLGLSVVWAIAQAHNGRSSVRNLPDGGAEFTVTLPSSLQVL